MASRTAGTADTRETLLSTSGVRIWVVTSFPSAMTRCVPCPSAKSIRTVRAMAETASASDTSTPRERQR